MRQEEDRRDEVAYIEKEERRRAMLEKLKEPEPEGITPEQMELIRDARTKIYWIYKTKNIKELEVEKLAFSSLLVTGHLMHAFDQFSRRLLQRLEHSVLKLHGRGSFLNTLTKHAQ